MSLDGQADRNAEKATGPQRSPTSKPIPPIPQAAIADGHETTDADHGRLETRRCAVVHDIAWLCADARDPDRPAMLGLATIVRIEAELERDGKIARSRRYQLSSARLFAARAA